MPKRLNLWHAHKRAKGADLSVKREYERLKKTCANELKKAVKDYEKNIANNAVEGS